MPITMPGDPPPNPKHRWIVPAVIAMFALLLLTPLAVVKYHNTIIERNQNDVIDALREYAFQQEQFFEKNKRYAAAFDELSGNWAQVQDLRALKPTEYHGYRFRAFSARGKFGDTEAREFVDASGKMTGGYALIAVPAEYGYSGRFTFFISDPGDTLYYNDLGVGTEFAARGIDQYFIPQNSRTMKGKLK